MNKELDEAWTTIYHYNDEIIHDLGSEYIENPLKEELDIVNNALLELKAIKEANPSEALKSLENLSWFKSIYDTELYVPDTEEYNTIKQALIKAQEQEKTIAELCYYYGLVNLTPYNDLKRIETSLKNIRDISCQQRIELIEKLNKQEKENARLKSRIQDLEKDLEEQRELAKHYLDEQEKVLEIIKEKNVDIKLLKLSASWLDYYTRVKHKTGYNTELTEEEFELLKRWLG